MITSTPLPLLPPSDVQRLYTVMNTVWPEAQRQNAAAYPQQSAAVIHATETSLNQLRPQLQQLTQQWIMGTYQQLAQQGWISPQGQPFIPELAERLSQAMVMQLNGQALFQWLHRAPLWQQLGYLQPPE